MAGFDTVIKLKGSDKERIKYVPGFFLLWLIYKGTSWFKDGNSSNRTDVLIFD